MIRSFGDRETAKVWNREQSKRFGPELQRAANRKLRMLDAAGELEDLRIPPGNRLEKLSGNRRGQHSIRVNDQWRICFRWTSTGPTGVEIVDYH
ncbi:MAG: type II toxin-antitoxin system RelE/ParE family toxin [Actinomycetales bacterium]|nr:type II toxin-antitoxin system RelE/ParE family toxin [Actinomycetales bacterium]